MDAPVTTITFSETSIFSEAMGSLYRPGLVKSSAAVQSRN
jgi:hypothetical protein